MTHQTGTFAVQGTTIAGLKETVALAGRILNKLGMVDYLGHVSARTEGGIIIKPKHSPKITGMDKLEGRHMIVVDVDGTLIEGDEAPPAEVFIHTEIYRRRPDVQAVVHTHQPAATTLGLVATPLKPLLHIPSSYVSDPDVGLWPCPLLVTNAQLGAELADSVGQRDFCHLQGHGIVALGGSVEEAVVRAVMLEEQAQANLAVLSTGLEPREITPGEIEQLQSHRAPVAGRWAYLRELVEAIQ
ncbi:class II aldolase/adducin family protein [Arthrobacter ginkgonis]|uniref:Class II aldolase/adducin family protein n=1 Tax=Arthrobacter ginkgonis TaxID=1630594 RepID=A0ABP7BVP8_9MICC